MALIFLGVSLQEVGPLEQVPLVFRKAIQLDSSNILAWNGLRNYYERTDGCEAKKELVDVYFKLLEKERYLFNISVSFYVYLHIILVIKTKSKNIVRNWLKFVQKKCR